MEVFKKYYLCPRDRADQRAGFQVNPNMDAIKIELTALKVLEDNFINEPRIDHYPFPKLIQIPHKKINNELCECYECQLHPEYSDKWCKQYPDIEERYRHIGRKIRFDHSSSEHIQLARVPVVPCYSITTTHCGISLTRRNFKKLEPQPINLYNTVECIINNLRNVNLIYRDIRGSNICINKNSNILLIDFATRCRFSSSKEGVNDFYKKPDLNELEQKVEKAEPVYDEPWSILYMF